MTTQDWIVLVLLPLATLGTGFSYLSYTAYRELKKEHEELKTSHAQVWDECVEEAFYSGWLGEWDRAEMHRGNPYREDRADG